MLVLGASVGARGGVGSGWRWEGQPCELCCVDYSRIWGVAGWPSFPSGTGFAGSGGRPRRHARRRCPPGCWRMGGACLLLRTGWRDGLESGSRTDLRLRLRLDGRHAHQLAASRSQSRLGWRVDSRCGWSVRRPCSLSREFTSVGRASCHHSANRHPDDRADRGGHGTSFGYGSSVAVPAGGAPRKAGLNDGRPRPVDHSGCRPRDGSCVTCPFPGLFSSECSGSR